MEDSRLRSIESAVKRIEEAITGSIEGGRAGILEEQRNQKKQIEELNKLIPQVAELITFKNNIRKIVLGIAAIIPVAFEILKLGGTALWEMFKSHPK